MSYEAWPRGDIFVYCSKSLPDSAEALHGPDGPGRLQAAVLRVCCSRCRHEAVELVRGGSIEDHVTTLGDVARSLRSDHGVPVMCYTCDAETVGLVYAKCRGSSADGIVCKSRSCDGDNTVLLQLTRAQEGEVRLLHCHHQPGHTGVEC